MQQVEQQGGMAVALDQGFAQRQLGGVAARRAQNIATRRDVFVGTNKYPNLGEKAVKAAHERALPASTLKLIDEAKKYAEGRAVRIEVKSKASLGVVKKLVAIKMAN